MTTSVSAGGSQAAPPRSPARQPGATTSRDVTCLDCGRTRRNAGRGRCDRCYWYIRLAGYPEAPVDVDLLPAYISVAQRHEAVRILRGRGLTIKSISFHLGYSERTVQRYVAKLQSGPNYPVMSRRRLQPG